MAFANFFDRTATAASQVLSNFNLDAYKATLSEHLVGLYFDEAAAASPEGRATLDLCVRILARLYPAMAIAGVGSKAEAYGSELKNLALAINDRIDLPSDITDATIVIVVGSTDIAGGKTRIFAGSDGWRALISQDGPLGSGSTGNPFGAGAAACFAAANVFRFVFADQLTRGELDRSIDLSMFDYRQAGVPGPSLPDRHRPRRRLSRRTGRDRTRRNVGALPSARSGRHSPCGRSRHRRPVEPAALRHGSAEDVDKPKSRLARTLLKREGCGSLRIRRGGAITSRAGGTQL